MDNIYTYAVYIYVFIYSVPKNKTKGVQLHDPGPRFGCDVVETEPTVFTGTAYQTGGCRYTTSGVDTFDPRTTWCYPGGPKPCRTLPPVSSSATVNRFSSFFWGTRGRITNVYNPEYPHVCDGKFTGFEGPGTAVKEWKGVTSARGRFTNAYFDYDGERLHILNDCK